MSRLQKHIELERGAPDRLVPKDFGDILTRRYLPVLSLTYVSSVLGIAVNKGNFYHYIFEVKTAYMMGLLVALWVSIPAVIWIILHSHPVYKFMADVWYKIIAALMVVTLMLSFVLFPEVNAYGLRLYFGATIPVFLIMYLFFVKGGLPAFAAHPLTAIGLTVLVHGAVLHLIHH